MNCPQRGFPSGTSAPYLLRSGSSEAQKMPSLIKDLRILIVDDSDTTRQILGTIVRSCDWVVCGEAEDGWSGVRQFQELRPDAVLLDLSMPDIDGLAAARMMSGSDPTVPIILFTAVDADGLEEAARHAGICAVVPKMQSCNLLKTIETAVTKTIQ